MKENVVTQNKVFLSDFVSRLADSIVLGAVRASFLEEGAGIDTFYSDQKDIVIVIFQISVFCANIWGMAKLVEATKANTTVAKCRSL